MKLSRLQADGLLFFTTIIWGSTFVAQKYGNALIDPSLFVGIRFLLAAVILFPFAWRERRRTPTQQPADNHIPHWLYVATGLSLAMASILQQWGLTTTSVTNSGFVTSLYVAMVPFAAWGINKTPIRPLPSLAALVAVVGAWLLSTDGKLVGFSQGDLITIISDIGWALQITLTARAARLNQQPFSIAFAQYAITGVIGLGLGLLGNTPTWADITGTLPPLLYASLLSSSIGFTIPCFALRYTPEAEGAVIMSLEGVVSAVAGAFFLGDRLTPLGLLGCALILLGVLMVELSPLLGRSIATAKQD